MLDAVFVDMMLMYGREGDEVMTRECFIAPAVWGRLRDNLVLPTKPPPLLLVHGSTGDVDTSTFDTRANISTSVMVIESVHRPTLWLTLRWTS